MTSEALSEIQGHSMPQNGEMQLDSDAMWILAGCIISIRPTYSCARALTYLNSWLGAYKTYNICETVEDKAKVTLNGLYKVVHGL